MRPASLPILLLAFSLLVPLASASATRADAGVCASLFDGQEPSCCPHGRVQVRVETKCYVIEGGKDLANAASGGPCAQASWEPQHGCGLRGCHGRLVVAWDAWCMVYVSHTPAWQER